MSLALPRQVAAFVVVGVTAAATHFAVVWILVAVAATSPEWANVLAFGVAFCVSYEGHRRLTWPSAGSRRQSMTRWLTVSVGGFLINQCLYVFGLRYFPQVHYLLLLLMVTAAVTILTFGLGKYWAFFHR